MKPAILLLLCAGLLAGCGAGSGEGLNEQGLPLGNGGGDNEPEPEGVTLTQLQEDIFGAVCTQCHTGAAAPQGLRLDSEQISFDALVGQPSTQQPELLRVEPGAPDQSYLVRKLEGDESIDGQQMPLGLSPLSSEQIAQVRDWIANGAPREGTGVEPTSVLVVRQSDTAQPLQLAVRFSRPVSSATLSQGLQVYLRNGDQRWLLGPDAYALEINDRQRFEIRLRQPDIPATAAELIINDPAAGIILDIEGRAIDGDRDRKEGGIARYEYDF